ncbi:hypothetical protein NEIG_01942 [Nematocida sp. ERTm5]|nr:hypothetical protein NEIRO02_0955 [Nematocida sp. AWRm79]KAI5183274.1 hypothetical protein NEIRO03_0887 [Nematocida sp. AWRm78]OAG33444.1 hypothetical protein NEIG_01942 [Nematocida sp. ERTm5]
MKFKRKKQIEEHPPIGYDLATKNTELKEEIKDLKERQNTLVQESLKHQYLRYKMQSDSERILTEQRTLLLEIIQKIEQGLALLKEEEAKPINKKTRQPFKENPKQKNKLYTE